jgi:probable RNA-binding protein EIF1AD
VALLTSSNWLSDEFIIFVHTRPAIFKSTSKEGSEAGTQEGTRPQIEEEPDSDEDDDLPPLEANTNRQRPFELYADSESDSDS